MVNEERGRQWVLSQERALELYELLMQTLDPNTWELMIISEKTKMTLEEFKGKSLKKLNPYGTGDSRYCPSEVAYDCLTIFDSLKVVFDNMKSRIEDAFKTILIVNEDMNEFISRVEEDRDSSKNESLEYKSELEKLREENKKLREALQIKEEGFQPIYGIFLLRVEQMLQLYDSMKKFVGDEKKMSEYRSLFVKEIDFTKEIIRLRTQQVLQSPFAKMPEMTGEEQQEMEEEEPEKVVASPFQKGKGKKTAKNKYPFDEEIRPDGFEKVPEEIYVEAVRRVYQKNPKPELALMALHREMNIVKKEMPMEAEAEMELEDAEDE